MTGTQLAAPTLRAKQARLGLAARLAGVDTEDRFAILLGDREQVDRLLDVLWTKHGPATVVNDVVALCQFGEWAVLQGHVPARPVVA